MAYTEAEVQAAMRMLQAPQKQVVAPYQENEVQKAMALLSKKQSQTEEKEPSFNYLKFIADNLAKGAISMADLPVGIANLLSSPKMHGFGANYDIGSEQPEAVGQTFEAQLPAVSPIIEHGIKNVGYDVNSEKPTTGGQRILGHALQFAGGMGASGGVGSAVKGLGALKAGKFLGAPEAATAAGKAAEIAKLTAAGAGIGGASGVAQELGVDPLVADVISAITVPSAASKVANVGKYIGSAPFREKVAEGAAREKLLERIGPKYIKETVENVENYVPAVPGYKGTTAEQAKSVGLNQLQNSRYGAIPDLAMQEALDNAAIRETSERIGKNPEAVEAFSYRVQPEVAGEEVRGAIAKKIKNLEENRKEQAKKPYKDVAEFKELVNPIQTNSLIEKELEVAKGAYKRNLLNIRESLKPNKSKGIGGLPIGFEGLGEDAKRAILKERNSTSALELENVVKEISGMAALAKKNGARERHADLIKIKKVLLDDLASTPEALARSIYSELSKPINEIERNKVFGKAVKKDLYSKEFMTDKGEIAKKVINKSMASPEYAEGLMSHIAESPEAIKSVQGYINDNLINSVSGKSGKINLDSLYSWKKSNPGVNKIYPEIEEKINSLQRRGLMDELDSRVELGAHDAHGNRMVTADKMKKFLSENRKILEESFSKDEMHILDRINDAIQNRQRVRSAGTGPGSHTAQSMSVLEAVYKMAPKVFVKTISSVTGGGYLANAANALYHKFNNTNITNIIDKALVDPEFFKTLMTPVKDIKANKTFRDKMTDAAKTVSKPIANVSRAIIRSPNKKELMNIKLNYNEE